ARLEVAEEELVAARVVAFGLRDGKPVLGRVGEAHAEAIRLYTMVACALVAGAAVVDLRKKTARRIAAHDVRIDIVEELVLRRVPRLDAVERLAIGGVRFATDVVRHARR